MSSTITNITIKTEIGSKVLPGDKRGLPWEIWRIILSCLSAEDLCRSAIVCKTWNDLVLSLDHTKWKELYLQCTDWRHPFWPLNLHAEPTSWRQAYKERYLISHLWVQNVRELESVTCMSVFKRNKNRRTITVGVGKEHESLKSALAVANDYDKIVVYPGIYDEQFEMSSKIPFELVGCGELGSVILVVCIEQTAITGRVSNLVFRAPWFTNFILKVRSGYLQVDNCILEDGMVYVQNPGTVCLNFCTFRHATVILQYVNASIIRNCEFSQTDSAAITVEGYPKDDKNWTYRRMMNQIMSTCSLHQKTDKQKSGEAVPKSVYSTAISLSTTNQKSDEKASVDKRPSCHSDMLGDGSHGLSNMVNCVHNNSHDVRGKLHDQDTKSCDLSLHSGVPLSHYQHEQPHCGNLTVSNSNSFHDATAIQNSKQSTSSQRDDTGIGDEEHLKGLVLGKAHFHGEGATGYAQRKSSTHSSTSQVYVKGDGSLQGTSVKEHEKLHRIHNFVSDCVKYKAESSGESTLGDGDNLSLMSHDHTSKSVRSSNKTSTDTEMAGNESPNVDVPGLDLSLVNSRLDRHGNSNEANNNGPRNKLPGNNGAEGGRVRSLSSSEVSLHSSSGGSDYSEDEQRRVYHSDSMSTSEDESQLMTDSDGGFSSSEESVIMLTYPERHQPRSLSAQKDYADVMSISSQNQSEHIDIIHDNDMREMLNDLRGCFIHRCRMTQSKGGVMVSLQAHAIILECEINSVGYGIRCIQNSRVVILKNEIHHCSTAGVFMRLAASGLITGNDIHSNCEAGVDIRKNADPIVQCNRIHHGKRSGVVVLGSGRGQIKYNDIYQNKEAGVYILYRGNPTLSHNQIYSGRSAGIAVNEGGRGYIHNNVITGNQWGGIDIRHGGDPIISHNTVCNGVSDGIVIGEGGRGSVENNIITGNAGCGVWIKAAHQPLIHGNEIHSNRDSGISLVNKMDSSHNNESLAVDHHDNQSHHSMDFWSIANNDQSHPKHHLVTIATVEHNKVYRNNGTGVSVQFSDAVVIQCNYVHGNKCDGIHVDQAEPAVVKDNSVTYNLGSGVVISPLGKVEIRGNGIYDNRDYGILCQNEAKIEENDIVGNINNGIQLKSNGSVKVLMNRVQSSTDTAVNCISVKDCVLEDNVFYSDVGKGIEADRNTQCSASNNQMLPPLTAKSAESTKKDNETSLGVTRWLLTDPAPRPHIKTPPEVRVMPVHHVTSAIRVTAPSDHTCEQGSKFCVIV